MNQLIWRSVIMAVLIVTPVLFTFAEERGEDDHGSFPMWLNGTMMPFDFSRCDTVVPWGDDMKPVSVNYVARHGARYLSSEKKVASLAEELRKAEHGGYISPEGLEFVKLLETVDSVTSGEWGALNAVGIAEEKELGRQMAKIAPDLLKKGRVSAVSTYVPRVVMTMYEVCHQLAKHSSDLEITASEGRQFSPLLRFFTTDPAYVAYLDSGQWTKAYDSFVRSHISARPAQSLFSVAMDADKMRKLTLDMYGVLQSLPASKICWTPEKWFSEKDYRACWEAANLKHYYQRSVSRFSDLPAKAAVPLLESVIRATNAAISDSQNIVGHLWFGHAETVIPLFTLMRLPGCRYPDGSADEIAERWKDWEVAPLAANLLMVLLRDNTGDYHVAMRLNGKWISFGMFGSPAKTIRWEVLESKWLDAIHNP